jgi:hypothetical protein
LGVFNIVGEGHWRGHYTRPKVKVDDQEITYLDSLNWNPEDKNVRGVLSARMPWISKPLSVCRVKKQHSNWECGYYLLAYFYYVIMGKSDSFVSKVNFDASALVGWVVKLLTPGTAIAKIDPPPTLCFL